MSMETPRQAYGSTAQAMLDAGTKWLNEHPDADLRFEGSPFGDNEISKELAGVIADAGNATPGGATLGMAVAVESRLLGLQAKAKGKA